jgi:hypothetical protein
MSAGKPVLLLILVTCAAKIDPSQALGKDSHGQEEPFAGHRTRRLASLVGASSAAALSSRIGALGLASIFATREHRGSLRSGNDDAAGLADQPRKGWN